MQLTLFICIDNYGFYRQRLKIGMIQTEMTITEMVRAGTVMGMAKPETDKRLGEMIRAEVTLMEMETATEIHWILHTVAATPVMVERNMCEIAVAVTALLVAVMVKRAAE